FLKAYCDEDIYIVDNGYQPHISEMVDILYDLNSRAEAMRIGYDLLRAYAYYGDIDGKQHQKDFLILILLKMNSIV
ncbi:6709_t:CDS:2, partial [Funneliformis geosporum]